MITISDIQLVPVRFQKGLVFFVSFVLDDRYFVGNVAVYTRLNDSGFRLVYPTKKLVNGKQIPLFYPISSETAQEIEKRVSVEAQKLLSPEDNLPTRYVFGSRDEDL